eukprot:g2718.t1
MSEEKEKSYDAFVRWIVDNGGQFPRLEIVELGNGVRGVRASSSLRNDELIMSIPYSLIFTVEQGKKTRTGKAILEHGIDELFDAPKHIFLMIFLLLEKEKGEHSFFSPYINILPSSKDLQCMPIFWEPRELALLKGSYILHQIQLRKDAIQNDYTMICNADPSFKRFSLDNFAWARMIVCSRNFGGTIHGVRSSAMVPMADLLNHKRPRHSRWAFDESSSQFTIHSTAEISAGSSVYDSYGRKCQHRFLLNYGFAVESNVEEDGRNPNQLHIEIALSSSSEEAKIHEKMRKFLLSKQRDPSFVRGVRMSMNYSEKGTMDAWSFLRFASASEAELVRHAQRCDTVQNDSNFDIAREMKEPVSTSNELRALRMLAWLMKRQLERYETSYEADLALMNSRAQPPRFTNRRNALIYILGEKEICRFYIKLCQECTQYLQMDWPRLRKALEHRFSSQLPQARGMVQGQALIQLATGDSVKGTGTKRAKRKRLP